MPDPRRAIHPLHGPAGQRFFRAGRGGRGVASAERRGGASRGALHLLRAAARLGTLRRLLVLLAGDGDVRGSGVRCVRRGAPGDPGGGAALLPSRELRRGIVGCERGDGLRPLRGTASRSGPRAQVRRQPAPRPAARRDDRDRALPERPGRPGRELRHCPRSPPACENGGERLQPGRADCPAGSTLAAPAGRRAGRTGASSEAVRRRRPADRLEPEGETEEPARPVRTRPGRPSPDRGAAGSAHRRRRHDGSHRASVRPGSRPGRSR